MKNIMLEKISQSDFYKYLEEGFIIEYKEIDLKYVDLKNIEVAHFQNCNFTSSQINFDNSDKGPKLTSMIKKTNISFHNCSFNDLLIMGINNLGRVNFFNTEKVKSIKISNSSIDSLIFQNNVAINYKIEIFYCHLLECFDFSKNDFTNKGIFNLLGNTFYKSSTILNNTFNTLNFTKQYFKELLTFENEFIQDSISSIKESEFKKANFNNSNFSNLTLSSCDFLSTTWFENCRNIDNSELKFVACEFKGFSLFNKSKINFLNIDRCTFDKSSSFTDAEFNTLKLFEVKFGGGAYFDEMKIKKVLDKSYLKSKGEEILEWKRTLRAIKQESQKTENKIDFNNYRNYELAAHYKELRFCTNFKDTSILWATKWSSDFGNWIWSLFFTLISGFFWYIILYRMENGVQYDENKINEFFVGAFRFFLVTDFSNPFKENGSYLINIGSWFIFIFGKIFIAFGIYEMIQSFRKFKA